VRFAAKLTCALLSTTFAEDTAPALYVRGKCPGIGKTLEAVRRFRAQGEKQIPPLRLARGLNDKIKC